MTPNRPGKFSLLPALHASSRRSRRCRPASDDPTTTCDCGVFAIRAGSPDGTPSVGTALAFDSRGCLNRLAAAWPPLSSAGAPTPARTSSASPVSPSAWRARWGGPRTSARRWRSPRPCTTSASSRCRGACWRSRGRSGPRAQDRAGPHRGRRAAAPGRKAAGCASRAPSRSIIMNDGTGAATRAGWPASRSRSAPASSPWPTSSTPSPTGAATVRPSPRRERSSTCACRAAVTSIPKWSSASSISCL